MLGAGVLAEVGADEHERLEMGVGRTVSNLITAVAQEAFQHIAVLEEGLEFYFLSLCEGKGSSEGASFCRGLLAFALCLFQLGCPACEDIQDLTLYVTDEVRAQGIDADGVQRFDIAGANAIHVDVNLAADHGDSEV